MRVLMILDEEFPPDSRVEKEINSLVENGFYLILACYTRTNRPLFEQKEGWEIRRIAISNWMYKLKAAILMLPFYNRFWLKFVRIVVKDTKIDVVHVHDLPMLKVGYRIAKEKNARLFADQHEYFSDWIVRTAHMNTLQGKIVGLFSNWKGYEKKHLHLADKIATVAVPLKICYQNEHNIPESKIINIPNTPRKSIFVSGAIKPEITNRYANHFVIFYAGGLDVLRGIDTAIKALRSIKAVIPNVKLVLGGRIFKPYDPIKTATELGVESCVEFVGWIDEQDLPSYITASSVCFFTPPPLDELNLTIATKIYQYAIVGRPIIVSDAELMRNFVTENKIGYAIRWDDDQDFAAKTIDIFNHKITIDNTQINTQCTWEQTVTPMLDWYLSQK